jgi:hypothetical protein
VTLVLLSLIGLGVVLFDHYGPADASGPLSGTWTDPLGIGSSPALDASPAASPPTPSVSPTPKPTPPVTALHVAFPKSGPQTYRYATGDGPVLGTAGPIRRFHVAIESNIEVVAMADFVAKINATLGDPRSWIAGRTYRLQQVSQAAAADFTVLLVTEATSSHLCAPLYTGGYTSCRQGSHVVLNLDRWMTSVPDYVHAHETLNTYRTYMINHEVGHALGHSHELCPGKGQPAPVMEQQTLGLHGCTANPWPYINGEQYDGPLGRY